MGVRRMSRADGQTMSILPEDTALSAVPDAGWATTRR